MLQIGDIVSDIGSALKHVDSTAPQGRSKTRVYQPGIGPLTEAAALAAAVDHLKQTKPSDYVGAGPLKLCDLVIPEQWAIEVKLIRPFGDNGAQAEHWSENVLHPYPGNISSIGDCLKLCSSSLCPRRAVLVFGYEHTPPQIPLELAIAAFEMIAQRVLGIRLGTRNQVTHGGLIHPVHQQLTVYGWQIERS
jgi:hypothetical protein